ncbi:MAG: capsular biosynthesis protein [bacterium]|nr:capsular biosynthesis protein [bacterium]
MGFLDRFFSKKASSISPLKWDMHNHILFGIDDGSKTIENSLIMANYFVDLGYSKIIATPHIMANYYENTPEIIGEKRNLLNAAFSSNGIPLEIDFAAEYYMDEYFLDRVKNREKLMTFDKEYVLVETSFLNKPIFFTELVFDLRTQGYSPVFAHPERYVYLQNNYEQVEKILETGIKFQINLLSLIGYYSPGAKKLAQWLIQNGHYSFLGTDAHSVNHLELNTEVLQSKLFNKIDFTKVINSNKV